ncbi:phage/plasmid primase, P4 family [Rossellomorea aquimaris]|uniref:DNA primase family protein n=1 Tax=Rossellomorea aquimaris TaxID=189382 RepID=UPI001CD6C6C2|nr:phage/plasmid primase, P4 family [Rossellomorea aquimaris]MCA1056961.1 phage/plasmid primase, P4 family [Rossellomorea aquimaris]
MNKEKKMFINISLEEEGLSQSHLYNEAQSIIETEQIKKPGQSNGDVLARKSAAVLNSVDTTPHYDYILKNNVDKELKVLSKQEVDLPVTYYKERESADKRKSKDHLIGANLAEMQEEKKTKNGSKQPIDYLATTKFLAENIVKSFEGQVRIYDHQYGYFKDLSETELHIAIRKSLPKELDMKLPKNKIIEVAHRIRTSPELQLRYDNFDCNTHLINFRDLVYDTTTGKTYPHSSDFLFTSYIDADYRKKQIKIYKPNTPYKFYGSHLDQLIQECTGGDVNKAKSLQQVTGYIISNEWRAKKFFLLIGLPHTGKSVWLSIWRALIGSSHTTSMSLNQIGSNRFMTAEFFKSKLNITAELDENGKIQGTSVIKAVTGGDLLTAERKGEDPFHFYGRTKLVAAGNYMPPVNKLDGTSAFTDRLHFLMFNHPVPEEKRDKELLNKLLSEKERTKIIHWALEGLEELKQQNFIFTESDDAKEFKKHYIGDLNNVPDFIDDMCIVDTNNYDLKVQRKHLYPSYFEYCKENGVKALSKSEFFIEIKNLGVKEDKLRMYGSNALRGFRGISLKTIESEMINNVDKDY